MMTERLNPHGMRPEDPVVTFEALCLLLGGAVDSWTGMFLRLYAKSDPSHRRRLAAAFPVHAATWEAWQVQERPTVRWLTSAVAARRRRDG